MQTVAVTKAKKLLYTAESGLACTEELLMHAAAKEVETKEAIGLGRVQEVCASAKLKPEARKTLAAINFEALEEEFAGLATTANGDFKNTTVRLCHEVLRLTCDRGGR